MGRRYAPQTLTDAEQAIRREVAQETVQHLAHFLRSCRHVPRFEIVSAVRKGEPVVVSVRRDN